MCRRRFGEFVLTWLNKSNVEDLIDLAVISGDVKDALRRVLNARDVDWHQVLGDLLPLHLPRTTSRHMEHFRPQPKYTNDI